jgi:uncharacterized C2H2 Zn-finger protein
MTIQYYDEILIGHNERKYVKCPHCPRIIRSKWRLTRHLTRFHGIEVKRY